MPVVSGRFVSHSVQEILCSDFKFFVSDLVPSWIAKDLGLTSA